MKLIVFLGVVGFVGIVASHFQTVDNLRDERDQATDRAQKLDQLLKDTTTASESRIRDLQTALHNAADNTDKLRAAVERTAELERQLATATDAISSQDVAMQKLRMSLAKVGPVPAPQATPLVPPQMQPTPPVNMLASRQAQIDALKVRLKAAAPWEQMLVEALDRELESGGPVDSDLLRAANKSRLASDLIAIYDTEQPRGYPSQAPSTNYQRAYEAAGRSDQIWADGIKKMIEGGTTADELLADPYMRQQSMTDPLVAALIEMARSRSHHN